jgi:hypothetical protein
LARNCCWNCKFYIVKGDNEPAFLKSALANVCAFECDKNDEKSWEEKVFPTPPGYVCWHYKERFY